MNLQEAYKTLGLANNASEEEAKKKYKELSRKYHPDVNKSPEAEPQFKKINEAYDRIKKGDEPQPQEYNSYNPFSGFSPLEDLGFINSFTRDISNKKRRYSTQNIILSANLSFKDSVLGVKKNFTFNRKIKCQPCNGEGNIKLNNGCTKCQGKGQTTSVRGQMVFVQTCNQCFGKINLEECKNCSGEGILDTEASVGVSIPGGVVNGNILRLNGMGNYAGSFGSMDQFSDAHLFLSVEEDSDLHLDGDDVISKLDISLLDALQGCNKTVKTVLGDKEINIKPLSKNNDHILIPNVGVNHKGNQKVILNVNYPEKIDNIIDLLKKESN